MRQQERNPGRRGIAERNYPVCGEMVTCAGIIHKFRMRSLNALSDNSYFEYRPTVARQSRWGAPSCQAATNIPVSNESDQEIIFLRRRRSFFGCAAFSAACIPLATPFSTN